MFSIYANQGFRVLYLSDMQTMQTLSDLIRSLQEGLRLVKPHRHMHHISGMDSKISRVYGLVFGEIHAYGHGIGHA